MKTVRLERPGQFVFTETGEPTPPAAGEARVRVRRSGVCGTDLHAFSGNQPFFSYPRILGHELGVEVVAVGAGVTNIAVGDKCAVEPYLNCGHCPACRQGRTNCCESLKVLGVHVDGGWREEIIVPANKLHRSAKLSLEQLALVETLGIGAHAVSRGGVARGENVLVVGAGPIGLAVMQFALLAGGRVTALDLSASRRAFAEKNFNVTAIDARDFTPDALRTRLGGELPSVVFDATGNAASMRASFKWPAHGGRLVLVGLVQGEIAFEDPDFHRRELTLLASRNSTAADFHRIIAAMEKSEIRTDPWITHRAALADVPEQFAAWTRPETGVVKAMIEL